MGPIKREQLIEDKEKLTEWQIKLETKRDFYVREVILWILKVLNDILEYKVL